MSREARRTWSIVVKGFCASYIFSLDHKMIGRQFLFSGLFMLVIGGLLAMMVRWQLGFPGTPLRSPGCS